MLEKLKNQRTYALVGHGGTGKSTIAELLLYSAGAINRLGKIEDGTTVLDYEPEEIKRRGSIQPGFAAFKYQKNNHFMVDTPGDNNFSGDLPYLLTAVDGVIFVLDAVDGVRPLSKKIWAEVRKKGLPVMFCITKMDRDRADYGMVMNGIKNILGVTPFQIHLPIGAKEDFKGVANILDGKAYMYDDKAGYTLSDPPAEMADEIEELRAALTEEAAVADDALMERYLEEGELPPEDLDKAIRIGVASGEIAPIVVCSALKGMGGKAILEAIQKFMPSPLDGPNGSVKEVVAADGTKTPVDPNAPLAAFVCKTLSDPFAGQLSIVRVMNGQLKPDSQVNNPNKDTKERIGQLLLPLGKDTAASKEPVGPGAIVALAKLKETSTGDTLCDEKSSLILPKPDLPPSMISYALTAEEKGEEDKVFAAMQKLLDEDINLSLRREEETGDILLSGMGQSHIELAVEKAKRRFKVGVLLKTPKVPYRETFKGKAEVQGRHKKQTGGRGQFGDCWVRFESSPSGQGYEFLDEIVGGAIPRQYIPAVDKGIQESAARGALAGYPMVDFKAAVYDGSFHTVDSSEMAFKIAGSLAFKAAMAKIKLVLLEPIMQVSVSIPDEFMGDVIGDLSSRRGRVQGSDAEAGVTEIQAFVPMGEIQEYAKALSSMTGGQGVFTMTFDHYEEAPPPVVEKVVADYKKSQED